MAGEKNKIIVKKKFEKEEEQKKGADRDTTAADANFMTLCMPDRRILHFDWVHLTNLMVFSVLAGAKYKRGDGQFIVGEISFLSDSDGR